KDGTGGVSHGSGDVGAGGARLGEHSARAEAHEQRDQTPAGSHHGCEKSYDKWGGVQTAPLQKSYASRCTTPFTASSRTRSPVRSRFVACRTLAIAGRPYSRAMVEACDRTPPTSTITPDASVKSGVHEGSVAGATKMAPRFIRANSPGSRTTTTSASTQPRL